MSIIPQELHDYRRRFLDPDADPPSDEEIAEAIDRLRKRREATTSGFSGAATPQRDLGEILGLPKKEK